MNTGTQDPFNPSVLYCEIYRTTSQHRPEYFYLLQRYVQVPKKPYCKFCKSTGHNEDECLIFDLMRERTHDAYRVQADAQGNEGYGHRGGTPGRGNFKGHGCGGMLGRGCG